MPNSQTAPPGGPVLADHVTETVDAISAFHQEHYESASPLQRTIDVLTDRLGRPALVAGVALGLVVWTAAAAYATAGDVNRPAFTWLQLAATVFALLIAMLILVTQRREDRLAQRRAQLTLELAILADRKSAKVIALIEELRRDHPEVPDRIDAESEDMATPADPTVVLAALDERVADSHSGGRN